MVGMRLIALGGTLLPGEPWLKTYDPNAAMGQGEITVTTNPAEAMAFASKHLAMECWRQVSTAVPTRWDGRPNRPLTAYSVEITEIPAC